jgi:tricorn protease
MPWSLLTLAALALAPAAPPRGYFRTPTVRADTIVFAAEGDLWRVPITGGSAARLTTHPGDESDPTLSPDGAQVAFAAAYEGATETYVMPSMGGPPVRLTYGGGRPVGWTRDGKVLCRTYRFATLPNGQLVTIDPKTRHLTRIPLAQASDGVFDDSGALYFTRFAFQGSQTKRYQGGTAQNLWKLTAGAPEAVPLTTDFKGTSRQPMWENGRLYFLSDRDGVMNVWSSDGAGKALRQVTHATGFDIHSPALDRGRLVYQQGADLFVADATTGAATRVPISLASDYDQLREKWITKPVEWITGAHLSPQGDRLVLTARGQVFVAPTGPAGRLVALQNKHGVRTRGARFLPDGKDVVALTDASGEVEIWKIPATGDQTRAPEPLTTDGTVLRWEAVPSPDGAWIAHTDKHRRLHLLTTATKGSQTIATSPYSEIGSLTWSADSRYLAYTSAAANGFAQIRIYDTRTKATFDATSDRFDSDFPAFSPDGAFLYFLSDRSFVSRVSSPWGSRQPEPFFDRQTQVFALALQPGNRSPFIQHDELEAEKTPPAADAKPDEKKPLPEIVADGLMARLQRVPVPAGNYGALSTDGKKLFLLRAEEAGVQLAAIAIRSDDIKVETLVPGVSRYELSDDRKKLLAVQGASYLVFDATGAPDPVKSRVTALDRWSFALDPAEEWRQMYDEAWRLHRDYFYDPKMHALDWAALRERYRPLVSRIACRADLDDVLAQLMGELSVLHTFVYGGESRPVPEQDRIELASLGAVWERDDAHGGWRLTRLYRTDPDTPDRTGPLLRPGVGATEGDVIARINGVATLSVDDPAVLLRAQAGQQVRLTIYPGGDAQKSRDAIVVPIAPDQEFDLRYDDWEHSRRLAVEQKSSGKLGYVHLRAMGSDDIAQWQRDYYPVFDRDGLILDVRHNNGGNIDSWILEKLLRKAWMYWQPPVGAPYWNMQYAFRGPIVVLCDESTSSDGEAFAEGFRRLGLGKVIGTRTWGGEVWLTSSNTLVDRGIATAAEFGVYGPDGKWLIEGVGVEPDIVVDNLPRASFDGKDAQLDAAIAYLQAEIKKRPNPVPTAPPYPDKSFPRRRTP